MKALTKYILSNFGGKVVTKKELEEVCRRFKANLDSTVNFMISYGYLIRILRGLYYVKTLEEFKLRKSIDVYRIISLGLDKLGINWYFGLYTALRLNGVTHEYSATIFILNDTIFRPKEIEIAGEKVKFIKLKKDLFGFGVKNENDLKFSDLEKTLLDIVYLSRYRSVPEEKIVLMLKEYEKKVNKRRMKSYLKFYPKSVERVVRNARLI